MEEEKYPRLEKLYSDAVRIQFVYDEEIEKAQAEKLANKEKNKKPDKKKGKVEETVEISYAHESEMKKSIEKEKNKFRFKLTLLKFWAENNIKRIIQNAQEIYSKLEDWIILADKAELSALDNMVDF